MSSFYDYSVPMPKGGELSMAEFKDMDDMKKIDAEIARRLG